MNDMNIGCFVALATTRSLPSTAAVLQLSKSAILMNIRRMEEELDVALFLSTQPEVRLSDAGERFYHYFKEFEEALFLAGTDTARQNERTVRLCISEFVGCPDWVLETLKDLSEKEPGIQPRITVSSTADAVSALRDGRVDLLLCSRHPFCRVDDTELLALSELPLRLWLSEAHPSAGLLAAGVVPDDLTIYCPRIGSEEEPDEACLAVLPIRSRRVRLTENLDTALLQTRLGWGGLISPKNQPMTRSTGLLSMALPASVTLCLCSRTGPRTPEVLTLKEAIARSAEGSA